MISTHVKWSMGLKLKFGSKLLDFSKSKPICHKYLFHRKGIIYNINGIEKVNKLKNVIKLVILKDLTFPIKLEEPTNTNRLLYVVTTGSNAEDAKKNAEISLSNIKLLYK